VAAFVPEGHKTLNLRELELVPGQSRPHVSA
jgi:hypothetical protein